MMMETQACLKKLRTLFLASYGHHSVANPGLLDAATRRRLYDNMYPSQEQRSEG